MSTQTQQAAPSPSGSNRRLSTQKIVAQNARPLEEEFSRMLIDSERDFQRKLDESISSQRDQHYNALQQAIERHEYVRKGAETAKRVAEAEEELKRTTQEQEEIRKLRELERRTAEAEAKRAEEQRQVEAQRQALEQEAKRRKEEFERQAQEQRARDEKEHAEQEAQKAEDEAQRISAQAEADRKAQEAVEAAKKKTTAPAVPAPAPSLPAASAAVQSSQIVPIVDVETEHKRFLQIHKELKDLRAHLRKDAVLKKAMNELRRELTKSLGQLTMVKGDNKAPTENVRTKLEGALHHQGPTIDIRRFIAYPPLDITDADAQKPMLFVYGINAFSKGVIQQLAEAADSVKRIDPIGVLTAALFANPNFHIRGTSLIDILLAKFHKSCGVLFGIYGPHDTVGGRTRLGWQKAGGEWVTESYHNDRMTGFGAGFAAIALRDFSKTKSKNPLPPRHFWSALARIINTPPKDAQPSHFLVLKSMIECGADRFVSFYGQAALVALRKAVIEFPSQAPKSAAANGALVLRDILAKNHGIVL